MGFIDRVKGLFGISFGGVNAAQFQSAIDWSYGVLDTHTPGAVVDPYCQSAPVAVAVSTIAQDAAAIDWDLYPEGSAIEDEEPIEDHPLDDLFDRPSAAMSGHQLKIGTIVPFLLWGEAFWYYPGLTLGATGGPQAIRRKTGELTLLDPRCVQIKEFNADGPVWTLRQNGQDVPLDSRYLTQFKRFNPNNPWRGLSPLAAAMMEVEGDYSAASWNRNYFSDQNGVPAGLLIPGAGSVTMGAPDRDALEKKFNSKHGRLRRSVGIIPPGWTWQDLGVTQRDMDFKALREYSREQILAIFGLPPFYAGVLDKANYANAREQKDVYWNGTISRLLAELLSTINTDFLPKIGAADVEVVACWEKVKALLEDMNEKADIAVKLFNIGFTREQINERLELGFDMTLNEDADVGYLPANLMPVDQLQEPRTPAGPLNAPPTGQDQGNAQDQNAQGNAPMPPKRYKSAAAEIVDPHREHRRAATWRGLAYRTVDLERRMNRVIRRHFHQIAEEALANVNGLKGWSIAHGVLKADDGALFDKQKAQRELQKAVEPIYAEAIKRGSDAVLNEIGVEISLPMPPSPLAMAELAKLKHRIVRIDDTVEKKLRDNLAEGVTLGESPQQLAARVRDTMDASLARSQTIARTETGFAFSGGRYTTMIQAGVERIEWLSARDSKVRDSHDASGPDAVDGEVTFVGTPFKNGLMYPLDPSAPPEEVINCRCVAVPVIERAR